MIPIQVTMDGIDAVVARMERMPENVRLSALRAAYYQSQRTLTKAKGYTPVDTGKLRSSGRVEIGEYIEIIFGGGGVDYAVKVHEDMSVRHKTGQAKFLERAVKEDSNAFLAIVAKAIGEGMSK